MTHRILLADDSVTIRKVVELTFSDEDFTIDSVGDGTQAIEHARAQRPDVIISDVIMPGLNGYELCQQVKADPDLRSVPFLFLKGTFESFDEEKARSCGSDGFIVKPFESQEMIAKVRELIQRAASAPPAPPVQQTRPPAPPSAPAAVPVARPLAPRPAPIAADARPAAASQMPLVTPVQAAPARPAPAPVAPQAPVASRPVQATPPPRPVPPVAPRPVVAPPLPGVKPVAPPGAPPRPASAPPPIPAMHTRPAPPVMPARPAPPVPPVPPRPTRPIAVVPPVSAPVTQPTPPIHRPPPPPPPPAIEDFGFDLGESEGDRFGSLAAQSKSQKTAPPPVEISGESDEDLWSEVSLRGSANDLLEAPPSRPDVAPTANVIELEEESALSAPEVLFEDEADFEEVPPHQAIPVESPATPMLVEEEVFEASAPEPAVIPEPAAATASALSVDQAEIERIVTSRLESVVRQALEPLVSTLARTMIEAAIWEVVPDLAEAMIKAEIERVRQSSRTE